MASIWMLLDDVPVDDFMSSIVVPFIKALGDHGIHANLEPTTNRIFQNEGSLDYALFPGGKLTFYFTTGPTHNSISGTIDTSRYMLANVKGIPNDLGITDANVNDAIRQFQQGLVDREIYGGRPQITEGKSLGGRVKIKTFSHAPSESRFRAAQPVATESNLSLESVATAPRPHSPRAPRINNAEADSAEADDTQPDDARRIVWPSQPPPSASETTTRTAENKRGCYIATAVYGDYDHPQVRALRRFRDESLDTSRAGRLAIRMYYSVSPALVRHIGDRTWFTSIVRPVLDALASSLRSGGISDAAYKDPE